MSIPKFRVWDNNAECYCAEPGYISIDGSGHFEMFTESEAIWESNGTNGSDLILEQFTGIKDGSGTDIYEGDIVEFTYWWFDGNEAESTLTGTIVYAPDFMSFQLKGVKNKEWEQFTGYNGDQEYLTPFSELNFEHADFKVIGHINT